MASQRQQARHDIAAALAQADARAGSWQKANLAWAVALAQSTGAQLIILNTAGGQVATITPAHHQPGRQGGHEPDHGTGGAGEPGDDHGGHSPAPAPGHHEDDAMAAAPAVTAAVLVTASPAAGADRARSW